MEMLKQEDISKRKKYQDNLLFQINEKINKQIKDLNSKYSNNTNGANDHINYGEQI